MCRSAPRLAAHHRLTRRPPGHPTPVHCSLDPANESGIFETLRVDVAKRFNAEERQASMPPLRRLRRTGCSRQPSACFSKTTGPARRIAAHALDRAGQKSRDATGRDVRSSRPRLKALPFPAAAETAVALPSPLTELCAAGESADAQRASNERRAPAPCPTRADRAFPARRDSACTRPRD